MAKNFYPKIVVIGGGTGSFIVLTGLRKYKVDLTAVVSVTDSGGSTGRLRSEFGFLPVGDMRQCLAALALSNGDDYIKKLLLYRFSKGKGLKGHNLGNLILTALTDLTGLETKAVEIAAKIFRLQGKVLPVTTTNVQLKAEYEDGKVIVGEHKIDEPKYISGKRIIKLTTSQKAKIYDKTRESILAADLIILGPGDLYTSILPNLIVDGVRQVLKIKQQKIVYIVNLMTRYSQTPGFTALDHLKEIKTYLGFCPAVILINNGTIPLKILKLYRLEKSYPVRDDLININGSLVIRKNLVKPTLIHKHKSDVLQRSFLRHDSEKLAKILMTLLQK